jgi:hypothetical protein
VCKHGLPRPLLRLVRACRFTFLVVTPRGYKSKWSPLRTPTSSHTIHSSLFTSFPVAMERGRERERQKTRKEKRRKEGCYWVLGYVDAPSLSSHGGTRLEPFQGHTGSPAKPREPRVHDSYKAHGLPRARGPRVPTPKEGYVVIFVTFYEQGIGAPSHRFLHLLLWHYDLGL